MNRQACTLGMLIKTQLSKLVSCQAGRPCALAMFVLGLPVLCCSSQRTQYLVMHMQGIHSCAIKFPDIASSVVHLLMDFLGDVNVASALDVVFFMREIMETNQKLRPAVLERLLDSFYQIRAARVCSCALWIIGEYCTSAADIDAVFEVRSLPCYVKQPACILRLWLHS